MSARCESSKAMSPLLRRKIFAVRRKHAIMCAGQGMSAMIGLMVLLLAAGMLLDWQLELPRWFRAALLILDGLILLYVLVTQVLAPVLFGLDELDVALMVEREVPRFSTRLIASVQLSRPGALDPGASAALVRAMLRQTEQMAGPMDFARVVRPDAFVRIFGLAALIVLLGAGAFIYGREVVPDLLRRALLDEVEVPRRTRVICLSGDRTIAIGDAVKLEAEARGVIPRNGWVTLEYDSGRRQRFSVEPLPAESRRFVRAIENVQESFNYVIRLNDGKTRQHRVRAVARPAVVALQLLQEYPAYTHRAAQKRAPGDLSLLAGSQLHVQIRSSKPLSGGSLRLVGLDRSQPLVLSSLDRTLAQGSLTIPPRGLSGISIHLTDDEGIHSSDETVYPIDVILDRPPAIRVTWPDRKEELATEQARVLIAFEASDDFGIGAVRVRYRVDRPAGQNLLSPGQEKTIELELADAGPEQRRLLRRRYELDLGRMDPSPAEGCVVEYWLEVVDGNTVTGPGQASSDRFRSRIVSELVKRADLMNRLNDQLGTIDQVTEDEEKLNQSLGVLILGKPSN